MLCLVAVGCSGDDGTTRWRDLTIRPPVGWEIFEQTTTVLSMADGPIEVEGERGTRTAAVQFTQDPRASPDDWRALIEQEGGTLEVDDTLDLDGIPGTRLVYLWETNGILTREMVVVIPARGIVILLQPIHAPGEDGPARFLEHLETFDQVLADLDFGAPFQP